MNPILFSVLLVLGGTFLNHPGRWMADSTRGKIVEEQTGHPVLAGVAEIWGNSDVYRTYKEGTSLPTGCTALVWGQPLIGRQPDDPPNEELEPLPVAWVKRWQTNGGKPARVFHSTMGSATDLKNAGLRRVEDVGGKGALASLLTWSAAAVGIQLSRCRLLCARYGSQRYEGPQRARRYLRVLLVCGLDGCSAANARR